MKFFRNPDERDLCGSNFTFCCFLIPKIPKAFHGALKNRIPSKCLKNLLVSRISARLIITKNPRVFSWIPLFEGLLIPTILYFGLRFSRILMLYFVTLFLRDLFYIPLLCMIKKGDMERQQWNLWKEIKYSIYKYRIGFCVSF